MTERIKQLVLWIMGFALEWQSQEKVETKCFSTVFSCAVHNYNF